jgi:PilZ domain-containing protein
MEVTHDVELAGERVTDRRGDPRRQVLENALIVFNNGHCSMGCQILDLSDTRAKLAPADIMLCPREFVLKPQLGESRHCEVMWRRGAKIGVRYVIQDSATMPEERRHHPRRRAPQKAVIVYNNGHSSMRCQIIDMSETGARLMPADISVCPRDFVLKLQSGEARHCAVMWRKETQMGVHYT